MKTPLLIVEDDRKIADIVARNLEAAGFTCRTVHDGRAALDAFEDSEPGLIVMDLNLPGIDGIELTRRVRRTSRVPILMLTARTDEGDKVLGFEVGADDYLTKPFGTRELVARVRALLRRSGAIGDAILRRGDLDIDTGRRVVERAGRRIELTTLEFDLLVFLASRPGHVYSREALMDHVWGDDRMVDTRSIDSLVSRLRRKLTRESGDADCIQTVWGAGYRFAETG